MNGSWIQVKTEAGTFRAYLSKPIKGSGPGLLVCQEVFGVNDHMRHVADGYAEEGYVVIVPELFWRIEPGLELGYGADEMNRALSINAKFDLDNGLRDIAATVAALKAQPACKGKVGAVGFCLGGKLAVLAAAEGTVDCAVSYYGVGLEKHVDKLQASKAPMVFHFAGKDKWVTKEVIAQIKTAFHGRYEVECYDYPEAEHGFNVPLRSEYDRHAASMANSRTIGLLRRVMGPYFNLLELWEHHLSLEFDTQDVDGTMATMVAEPYVNVSPTMTGGVGYKLLRAWYKNHFIFQSPPDTKIIPISQTVGADRVVDEQVFCFTHDRVIDWLLPGIDPTFKYVEMPLIAIASFRGGKLYNEHIYWDQASVLVQVGLLKPDGLPVVGRAQAEKLKDPESVVPNKLIPNWEKTLAAETVTLKE